jgi:hypothetical protein
MMDLLIQSIKHDKSTIVSLFNNEKKKTNNQQQQRLMNIDNDQQIVLQKLLANPAQRIRSESVESNQPTKSDRIPGCRPTFVSLVLKSDGILVSEFDGTYRWVLTDLYY